MYRAYEIFEVLPDGSTAKRTVVTGLEFAKVALKDLSKHTTNECIAADEQTHQIVAQLNLPPSKRTIKRIFQIAYDEAAGLQSAELLRSLGYSVISVLGNEAAKVLLTSIQNYDLFIVWHGAPEKRRKEMVDWLKKNYPKVRILAMNPSHQQIAHADYNVVQDGPESWLPLVMEQTHEPAPKIFEHQQASYPAVALFQEAKARP